MTATDVKKVLVYRSSLLATSEVWLHEQVKSFSRWTAVLVGQTKVDDGVELRVKNAFLSDSGGSRLANRLGDMRYLFGIAKSEDVALLKREQASLVHIHFGTDAVKVWPLMKSLDIPILVTLHGYDINIFEAWWQGGNAGFLNRSYPKRLLALSNEKRVRFIAVSKAIRRRAIEFGIPEDKVTVSHLGVDVSKFQPAGRPLRERKHILFVGRLVPKKGCQLLLEAFQEVQEDYPETTLIIVGTGQLEAQLRSYSSTNKLRVEFLGAQSHEQVLDHLSRAKLFCLPSVVAANGDAEGLPVSILEAQSCGVPVVTSARGGAEEGIIDGVTGYAHNEKDVVAIAAALRRLLDDEKLLESMGKAARAYMLEKMQLDHCTSQLEKIYDAIVDEE